jgi:hypothetical protein
MTPITNNSSSAPDSSSARSIGIGEQIFIEGKKNLDEI